MNDKVICALVLACALACGTLLAVSIASAGFLHWLHTLSPGATLLIRPLSAVATAFFLALGLWFRRETTR